jgi:hypothetical protein
MRGLDVELITVNNKEEHPTLQTIETNNIRIAYKAAFTASCFSRLNPSWDYQTNRNYFYVMENGYERNIPIIMPTVLKYFSFDWLCCFVCSVDAAIASCFEKRLCPCIPVNPLCTGQDTISKTYFDRGPYDRQTICFKHVCGGADPIFSGPPKAIAGPMNCVCCCFDCPHIGNECLNCCKFSFCFGEKVSVQSCEYICGVPLVACWLCNCCSLCGPKDGEPLCTTSIADCLQEGEAAVVAQELNTSYGKWAKKLIN